MNIQWTELEEHELVTRKIYPVVPPKVKYSLTELGQTVIPVIAALAQWSNENEDRFRDVILKHVNSSDLDLSLTP